MSLTPDGNEPQHSNGPDDLAEVSLDLPLVKSLSPGAVERNIEALRGDKNEDVRRFAARRLGDSGTPRAVEVLIDSLRTDDSLLVKKECAEALGRLGFAEARMALIEALSNRKEIVVNTLGNIYRAHSVSEYAAQALAQLPPPSSTQATALCSHLPFMAPQTQAVLFELLGKAGVATPGALSLMKETALYSMEPRIRGSAVRGLEGTMGEKAVDLFERVAKSWFSRRQTKEFALYSLGFFESPQLQRRIAGILEPFIQRAAEQQVTGTGGKIPGKALLGNTAVDALSRLPLEFSLDPLLRHLGQRNAILDQRIEGRLISLCGSGACIGPRLVQELEHSGSNPGRTAALIRILSELHDKDAIAHIVEVLGIEFSALQKRLVYGCVANAVGTNRRKVDDSTVRRLHDFARSEDTLTAEYAILSLSRLPAHAHSALPLLRTFLKSNEDANVARAACTALGALKLDAAIPDLQAVLRDPYMPPTVSEAARRALERLVE